MNFLSENASENIVCKVSHFVHVSCSLIPGPLPTGSQSASGHGLWQRGDQSRDLGPDLI